MRSMFSIGWVLVALSLIFGASSTIQARHASRHVHIPAVDPYSYRYEPRGYYPYYNSGYWRPAREMRRKRTQYYARKPPYYRAWGAPKPRYHHRQWHRTNHGRIRRGHW